MTMPPRDRPLIYLAARYSRRAEMQEYARTLEELGLARVPARWLHEEHDWDGTTEDPEQLRKAQQHALDDCIDIEAAHCVVVFTEEPGTYRRGGSLVELGMAVAMQKHVVVVGPAVNIFCTLPFVWRGATWPDALAHLVRWRERAELEGIRKRLVLS